MWVYTEKGQRQAETLGFRNRKAGEQAMVGYRPVDGLVAEAWERMGYIVWISEEELRHEAESSDT